MPSRLVPTVATKFLWVNMAPFYYAKIREQQIGALEYNSYEAV